MKKTVLSSPSVTKSSEGCSDVLCTQQNEKKRIETSGYGHVICARQNDNRQYGTRIHKTVIAALVLLLCLGLCSCGKKGDNQPGTDQPSVSTSVGNEGGKPGTDAPAGKEGNVSKDDTTEQTATPALTPEKTSLPTPELIECKTDASEISLSWNGEESWDFCLFYREKGSEKWMEKPAEGTKASASGLKNGASYELKLYLTDEEVLSENQTENIVQFSDGLEGILWLDKLEYSTESEGPGDPFKDIYSTIVVEDQQKDVAMSSVNGCLGAKVWPQHDCLCYENPELNNTSSQENETVSGPVKLKGGTALYVTESEDGYCYLRKNGRYSLYVLGNDNNGNVIGGWVDADLMFIDLRDIFEPENGIYGLLFDRTNAYSSIFTAGGSAYAVDTESAEDSRYDVIRSRENVFAEYGYNSIKAVTGYALPNYGPARQMPVIWDMALELITCQKNALKKGTVLLIYDAYRPNSTSHAVSDAVIGNAYLSITVNGTNLSKGFGGVNYGPRDYIGYNSRHNKGVAVDLTLVNFYRIDALGEELLMQTKMHTLDFRCNMLYNNDNAKLLYEIMTTETFLEPLSSRAEWWHFQLKNNAAIFPQINTYIYADYAI